MVRGSLGSTELGVATAKKYGFWVIPVPTLMELTQWRPHQDLRAEGKLREVRDDEDVEVMFISHQWTSFDHPDPNGEQLESLQKVTIAASPALALTIAASPALALTITASPAFALTR